MPRIIGVEIPAKKKVKISLTYIYGIGRTLALELCKKCKIDPEIRASELSDSQITQLSKLFEDEYEVEGDLRRKQTLAIKRLQAISSYRGLRHRRGLPVRGQRTKTNARTRKGKKRTVGAVRDKAERKMSR